MAEAGGMNEATEAQVIAARPDASTWLSANAGSGKTRVLTDRVARLLLDGVQPERILCLTYTKAAAMEMQNRLFKRLGEWAMAQDGELREVLVQVGVEGDRLTPDLLRDARRLFARAIEAPGGLKIQTIHSFCSSVLRRFPLEAQVSPGFTEIDERVQARLIAEILDQMAEDARGREAIDAVVPYLSDEDGIISLARAVAGKAEALADPLGWDEICAWLAIDPGLTEEGVIAHALTGDEQDICDSIWPYLDPENKQQAKPRRVLEAMPWEDMTLSTLKMLEEICLSGESAKEPFKAKGASLGNAAVRSQLDPDVLQGWIDLADRVEETRPLRVGFVTAQRAHALHRFAAAFLPAYAQAKQARGWLDFDDLIGKMRTLLNTPGVAQWVLFRLDGGIDHILVDEAQDTSPDQWDIVARLAEDFAAGEGARADVTRTIFVVGDKKQSIYSFQGADPSEFDRMKALFSDRLRGIGQSLADRELVWSFRSAAPILDLVDRVCAGGAAPGLGEGIEHKAFKGTKPGRVDLWPVIPKADDPEHPDWDDPRDIVAEDHHSARLAALVAERIESMLAEGEEIEVGDTRRPVQAGDILILVQRRSALFRTIISEIKKRGLPIAGVDRAQLTAPIAVKDLIALMRFLATPEDDLSLAAVLKSPLCGWSEDDLFRLAHARDGYLWRALRTREAEWPKTVAILRDLRDQADFMRPYDLLERALIRHDGRRRLIAQLGTEAEDAIDAILSQALNYERMEVPSLTGFVGWLDTGEVMVKRDLAQAHGMIRVMTVHGAKGLEAPVVILPDCAQRRGRPPGVNLVRAEGGPLVWAGARGDMADPVRDGLAAKSERDREEANRLLYVALTRAESWLIVAAAGDVGRADDSSWYKTVEAAMAGMACTPLDVPGVEERGLRVQSGDFPVRGRSVAALTPRPTLPEWVDAPVPAQARPAKLRTPSDLGGDKALPGEGVGDGEPDALRRGRLVHLLLEHLPRLAQPAWAGAAPGIAVLEAPDVTPDELAPLLAEATSVLTDAALAHLFTPEALAEVELFGHSQALNAPLMGVLDRLIVSETRVLAVDYKTNRITPDRPEQVPEGLLRQMGAYDELLRQIYPDRTVEVAILWSRTRALMPLPHDLVNAALAGTPPA
ncbi:double-strand break repair helicase AddA [Maritalea mobilis]|uniref:double-strand break repair helicase AddA n=1 Tax=Maritalea mobilis TaxID=483324 RepID=UPI001C97F250|nr:double-strand break repair helicase AddA [Maritalea mobilis]MBY6201857.1 double-strand break repair helicase AddA [Maritalea mobilis]